MNFDLVLSEELQEILTKLYGPAKEVVRRVCVFLFLRIMTNLRMIKKITILKLMIVSGKQSI